jgi:phage terminase large subunit-like protein
LDTTLISSPQISEKRLLGVEEKRELAKTLAAKKRAIADRKILNFKPTLIQRLVLLSKEKIVCVLGSNRAGKSEIIAVDAQIRGTGLIPEILKDEYPQEFIRGGEAWLCGLDFVSLMGIVKKKIDKFLPNRMNAGYNKENKIQRYTNGFEVQYRSCDQGREKFQGTSKTYLSFDEEPPADVYDEGYMRTVDCSGIIRLAFTPMKGLSWAYKTIYQKAHRVVFTDNIHGIKEAIGIVHTPEEIKLLKDRKIVTVTNHGAEVDDDIAVFIMAIYDNPYLPESEIWKAERKYADDPASYNARILGRFTTITGRNVFDTDGLLRRQPTCPKPEAIGEIVNGQFQRTLKGRLQIFKSLKELFDDEYVIGADVAEGLEIGDFSCAQVLSKKTGEQVAIWHGKTSPDEFASILVSMGKFFRNADLAPERNFHGFAVVTRIREHFKYPNLFSEYDASNLTKTSSGKNLTKRYGWDTNAKTKPLMIQELSAFLRANHIIINDTATIDELITYVYDRDGKTEAMAGCYDDRVMALAIALQVFLKRRIIRQPLYVKPEAKRNPLTGY